MNSENIVGLFLISTLVLSPVAHAGTCRNVWNNVRAAAQQHGIRGGLSAATQGITYRSARVLSQATTLATWTQRAIPEAAMEKFVTDANSVAIGDYVLSQKEIFYKNVLLELLKGVESMPNSAALSGGQSTLIWWLVEEARHYATTSETQNLIIDKINRVTQQGASRIKIGTLRLLLFQIAANPAIGFSQNSATYFDSLSLNDKLSLVMSQSSNLTAAANSKLQEWEPHVRLAITKQELAPALEMYFSNGSIHQLEDWRRNPQAPNGIALDGPNGYYDRTTMAQGMLALRRNEQRQFGSSLTGELYRLLHQIKFGLENTDRVSADSNARREPRFVTPALYGVLIILSEISHREDYPQIITTEQLLPLRHMLRELLSNEPWGSNLENLFTQLGIRLDFTRAKLGSTNQNSLISILKGDFNVDVLAGSSDSLSHALKDYVLWRMRERLDD